MYYQLLSSNNNNNSIFVTNQSSFARKLARVEQTREEKTNHVMVGKSIIRNFATKRLAPPSSRDLRRLYTVSHTYIYTRS